MSDGSATRGLRGRLTDSAEDRLGKALTELLENPLLTGAIGRAFDARERAAQAQEVAMGALNIPSAADIERLTRRLRSVSQRLEGIEDGVHRLDTAPSDPALDTRLGAIEEQLRVLTRAIGEVRESLPGTRTTVSHAQERLRVEDASSPARATPAKKSAAKSRKAAAKTRKPAASKH
jgi:chromosome segregation ATPase